MVQTYFSKFPTITYSNTQVCDITRRVVFPQYLKNFGTVFYPYDLKNYQRSDVLAYNYYSDTDADWLIYLVNGIIDPYYGWYLTDDDLNAHIIDKYGSLTDPQQRIKYWQINWAETVGQNATTSYYNALPITSQKYFIPVWNQDNKVIYYTRRQEDWFMETNQIWTLGVANNANFNVGDLVISNTVLYATEGTAEITSLGGSNTVIIKNIANTFSVGSSLQEMFGNTQISTPITSVSVTNISIPLGEAVFWEPITYYEYESDINEKNKSLLLLDSNYLNPAATTLQQNLQIQNV